MLANSNGMSASRGNVYAFVSECPMKSSVIVEKTTELVSP
jgi:hypothetical protein